MHPDVFDRVSILARALYLETSVFNFGLGRRAGDIRFDVTSLLPRMLVAQDTLPPFVMSHGQAAGGGGRLGRHTEKVQQEEMCPCRTPIQGIMWEF